MGKFTTGGKPTRLALVNALLRLIVKEGGQRSAEARRTTANIIRDARHAEPLADAGLSDKAAMALDRVIASQKRPKTIPNLYEGGRNFYGNRRG